VYLGDRSLTRVLSVSRRRLFCSIGFAHLYYGLLSKDCSLLIRSRRNIWLRESANEQGVLVDFWRVHAVFLLFLYLALALANVVGINVYLLVSKKELGLAKVFASLVTFPTILISAFFFSIYKGDMSHVLTAVLLSSAMVLGVGIAFLISPEKVKESLGRR